MHGQLTIQFQLKLHLKDYCVKLSCLLQVVHVPNSFLPDFCPLRVASPMARCQSQPPVQVEKMDMRRNLFGMVMKSCAANDNIPGNLIDTTSYFA